MSQPFWRFWMIPIWSKMNMSDPLNHLWSIWYRSEPLEVSFFPNQFLGWDFFAFSYSKMALVQHFILGNLVLRGPLQERDESSVSLRMSQLLLLFFLVVCIVHSCIKQGDKDWIIQLSNRTTQGSYTLQLIIHFLIFFFFMLAVIIII